jgi:predicted NBD/HSP70 family sugar kinase/biotin operon repressor
VRQLEEYAAKSSKLSVIESLIESGAMSRSDLAEKLGLSRSALTELSRELIEAGLIRETSVVHDGQRQGRPAVLLALNEHRGYVLGVSLQNGTALLVLCDVHGNVLQNHSFDLTPRPEACAAAIRDGMKFILQSSGFQKKQLLGIGLAISGFVDPHAGVCIRSNELDWSDVPIVSIVQRVTGVPTYLENDANAVATGEKLFGNTRKLRNFTIVTLSNAIGAGHYVGGRLYRGETGGAGEIGHYTMDLNGLACRCGKKGCLDTISGVTAMVDLARKQSLTADTLQDIERLASAGNPAATGILRNAGQTLGLAVSYLIQTNNPEAVVFAFTESIERGIFLTAVRQAIENNILPRFLRTTKLLFHRAEKSFWARGAASIAAHEFLREQASR